MGSTRVSDEKLQLMLSSVAPVTLPMQAYGREPIEWFEDRAPVWVWVSWPDRVAERTAGWALGGNNLVVIVEIPCAGGHWQPVVWRNAVSRRRVPPSNVES